MNRRQGGCPLRPAGPQSARREPPGASLDPIDPARLQLVADAVPSLLAYLDERVHYVWVNETYRRWFGRSPESICGRHAREIVGEAAWLAVQHHVARALAGEEVSYEARVDFGPGHTRDVRVTYVPDRDASGRVRGFVSRVTDISDVQSAERALRASERMLAESQTAAHVGSWEAILNDDGSPRSLRWSDETYRIFGHEPGRIAVDHGLFISSIHPDDRALLLRTAGAGIAAGDGFEAEFRIVRPDGAVRTIQSWTTVERDAAGRRDAPARHLPGHHRAQARRDGDATDARAPPGRRRRDARPDRPLRSWHPSGLGQQDLRSPLRQEPRAARGKASARDRR